MNALLNIKSGNNDGLRILNSDLYIYGTICQVKILILKMVLISQRLRHLWQIHVVMIDVLRTLFAHGRLICNGNEAKSKMKHPSDTDTRKLYNDSVIYRVTDSAEKRFE